MAKRITSLLSTAALVGCAAPALAQQATTQPAGPGSAAPAETSTQNTNDTPPPAAVAPQGVPPGTTQAPGGDTAGLEEIVVTAQKRGENLQKVPLAVTAIGAEAIRERNIVQPQDLANVLPGLRVVNSSIGFNISLRGIGTSNSGPIGTGAIAVHMDGAYQYLSPSSGVFFDIDRVELVAGPQGTLYGRGATGGSLNIITKRPVNRFEGEAEFEAGDYGMIRGFGMINVPITDTLAVRASFQSIKHDGYYSDGFFDQDEKAGRIQLQWQPVKALRVFLEYGHDESNELGQTQIKAPIVGDPFKAGKQMPNTDEHIKRQYITGQIDYDLGPASITYLGNYQNSPQQQYHWHNQGGDVDSLQAAKQQSHELRLTSNPGSRLTYVLGLYYLDQTGSFFQRNYQSNGFVNEPDMENESKAVFGQLTYALTDTLRLTGGARYSHDTAHMVGRLYTTTGIDTGFFTTDRTFNNTSWKGSIEYDVAPRSLLYANVGTGYRPGGINQGAPPDNTYSPEKVTHYEIGSKNRFLDNRLQVNGDIYYDDYTNYFQGSAIVVNPVGAGLRGFQVVNAGAAHIYGAEVNVGYALGPHDRIDLAGNYLHAYFKEFLAGGMNYAGYQLPNSPPFNATGSYRHSWDVGEGQLILRGDAYYSTGFWLYYTHQRYTHQSGFTRTNLDLTYEAPRGKWSVSIYVKNIEDSRTKNYGYPFMGGLWQAFDPPRTFGGKIGVRF